MARYIPGGRVVLADGTYELGAVVRLTRQKAHVVGMGGATHVRASTTGFNALFAIEEVHCRIGYMLMHDSGDTNHDLRYAVWTGGSGTSWPVIEHVHTHGAEFHFEDTQGPCVIQPEIHPQPVASDGPGLYGVVFAGTDPANGAYCTWGRLHGGWMNEIRRRAIYLWGALQAEVEGTRVHRASMDSAGTYSAMLMSNSTEKCSVMGTHIDGDGFTSFAFEEDSTCANNSILGNRFRNDGMSSNGTNTYTAANDHGQLL